MKGNSGHRKAIIVAAQAIVSITVLWWIGAHAGFTQSLSALRAVPVSTALAATAMTGAALIAGGFRWALMLRELGVVVGWSIAVSYYLMGLFLSLFLPTSVGGDAFRIYVVARDSKRAVGALLGTVQERFLGLFGGLAASLLVMPVTADILPAELRASVFAVQLVAIIGVVVMVRPSVMLRLSRPLARALERLAAIAPRLHSADGARRLGTFMGEAAGLMRESRVSVPLIMALAVAPVLAVALAYKLVLDAIGAPASAAAMVLIVPMVWIVRLLPLSLGGIGVGEGAFVLLAALAGIDRDKAFAAALAVLAVQVAWALAGGILLLRSGLLRVAASIRR